jgi:hypothetical protein
MLVSRPKETMAVKAGFLCVDAARQWGQKRQLKMRPLTVMEGDHS